jgi:hypothetical protein
VFAPQLDAGNLNAKYDVLVFVDGSILPPLAAATWRWRWGGRRRGTAESSGGVSGSVSAPFRSIGRSRTESLRRERRDDRRDRRVGDQLARALNLPIENHLVENGAALPNTKFYAPGSVLRAKVDTTRPVAAGVKEHTDFFFDKQPGMDARRQRRAAGVRPIAWFDSATPLRSGWAWGQGYLKDGVIAAEATVGKAASICSARRFLQRAQPHATFKFLFNAIYAR